MTSVAASARCDGGGTKAGRDVQVPAVRELESRDRASESVEISFGGRTYLSF